MLSLNDIALVPDVTKTRSGNIMRQILRSIVKGEPITEEPRIKGIVKKG